LASRGKIEERRFRPEMKGLIDLITSFRRGDDGQGLAEYALILALIAIVAIVALIFLGGQVSGILTTVGKSV
jgi:pilus assembly protein Flp/PilA